MTKKMIEKDERSTYIENLSYSFGYKFISFAILLDVVYRAIRYNQALWDLLIIVILSGLIVTAYQHKHKILGKTLIKLVALTSAIAFLLALTLSFVMNRI
ncbi:hypothetical protein [Oceanirhabdus sp. W0125-5]|uniref:hypothetical protein n=1 Tax=Oceanirhabdus sp. W0125-5 TaxID=2999116 RepID=UPI0022F2A9B8|nr:hypothetical protein [Oceanirhabdus sp. W0125-5]WBW95405.1 hypothetical protein OW730_17135 [Oceanirhabdus sp. W0125-5]